MPHGRETHRSRSQRGAAALEFALIVPILVAVVFGIVDFGYAINRDTLVNNAAREGAREGSLNPDATAIATTVRQSLSQVESPGASPSVIDVAVSCRKPDTTPCATFAADATHGGTVIVTVTLNHAWITPVGTTFGSSIALKKTVEMRIE